MSNSMPIKRGVRRRMISFTTLILSVVAALGCAAIWSQSSFAQSSCGDYDLVRPRAQRVIPVSGVNDLTEAYDFRLSGSGEGSARVPSSATRNLGSATCPGYITVAALTRGGGTLASDDLTYPEEAVRIVCTLKEAVPYGGYYMGCIYRSS